MKPFPHHALCLGTSVSAAGAAGGTWHRAPRDAVRPLQTAAWAWPPGGPPLTLPGLPSSANPATTVRKGLEVTCLPSAERCLGRPRPWLLPLPPTVRCVYMCK